MTDRTFHSKVERSPIDPTERSHKLTKNEQVRKKPDLDRAVSVRSHPMLLPNFIDSTNKLNGQIHGFGQYCARCKYLRRLMLCRRVSGKFKSQDVGDDTRSGADLRSNGRHGLQ